MPTEKSNAQMVRDALRKRLRTYFRQVLKPLGFESNSTRQRWTRTTKTLSQSCHFFMPNAWEVYIQCWYYFIPCFDCWEGLPQDARTLQKFERFKEIWVDFYKDVIAHLEINESWKIPTTIDCIDDLLVKIDGLVNQTVLPFFDKYQESSDVLSEYNAGIIGDKYINDVPGGWFFFDLALLRFQEQKYAESLDLFQKCLAAFREREEFIKPRNPEVCESFWTPFADGVELAVKALKKRLGENG